MSGSFVVSAGSIAQNRQRWSGYLTGIRARDSSSLALLYDETAGVLYGLALRMLNNPVLAEEVMLGVYRKIWESPAALDGADVLDALILQTRNQALEKIRMGGSSVPIEQNRARNDGNGGKALAGLSPEEREVVELAFFGGMNVDAIASALGASVDTIKSRICAGTGKLRSANRESQGNVH